VVEAPAGTGSQEAFTEPLALELNLDAGADDRDTFLPEGTDAAPEQIDLIAELRPAWLATLGTGQTLVFRMHKTTNFAGHTSNAPRGGGANDDYSFAGGADNTGPTIAETVDGNGDVDRDLFVKDWGGRTLIDARIEDLPGQPSVFLEIPLDSDGDFLPDAWERRFRNAPGVADPQDPVRDGLEDLEDRTLAGNAVIHNEQGDGFTALEEYRGVQAQGVVARMDEIPRMFGLGAPDGAAADGDLIAGPRVKDLFVQMNTGIVFGNDNADNFNVAFHRVDHRDYATDDRNAGVYGTYTGHDHRMNFSGDNDSMNIARDMQNAVHVRNDAGITEDANGDGNPDILPDGTLSLGNAGSFWVDSTDVRVNDGGAGMATGNWTIPGTADVIPMNSNDRNGLTIFHEIGHKMSLRHTMAENVYVVAVAPTNNSDVDGDGNPDGAIRVTVNTFVVEGTAPAKEMTRGWLLEHRILRSETGDFGLVVNDVSVPAATLLGGACTVHARDDYGFIQDITLVLDAMPIGAGDVVRYRSGAYFPTLMDVFLYPIVNGENLAENLAGPQWVVPPATTPKQTHGSESRIRTQP